MASEVVEPVSRGVAATPEAVGPERLAGSLSCDSCNRTVSRLSTVMAYGCEGDFCDRCLGREEWSDCPRCGVRTTEDYCCVTCEFELDVHAERLRSLARPYCECGDTGRAPREVVLGYVQLPPCAWEEQPECEECPRCSECGVELRLHPQDTMACP